MYRSNLQDREEAISAMGRDMFYSNGANESYKDIPAPFCYEFLFSSFLEMYSMSGEDGITLATIQGWCVLRRTRLSQFEIDMIEKMKSWAGDETGKLREDADKERRRELNHGRDE